MTTSSEAEVIDGRYVLEAVIGRGAMAEVRSGADLRLGRTIAVKLLHESLASQSESRLRFEEEARAAARLTDPNVVAIYDTGEHNDRPYIVMELLPGRTLRDELGEGPLSNDRAREVIVHVLRALSAAHAAGVIHRDIKPANILLTEAGHAKVADFGIAKVAESSDLTATGLLLGTPSYLAPECVGGHAATAASDLYAVGVVLYEALSGRRPFAGDTPLAVCHAIVSEEPTPLRELTPHADAALLAVVTRAMAKDPNDRYRNADEMVRAVEGRPAPAVAALDDSTQAIGAEPTLLAVGLPTEVLAPAGAPPPAVDLPAAVTRRDGRGARVWALMIGAAVLGLGLFLASLGDEPSGLLPARNTNPATTQPTAVVTTATTVPVTSPPTTAVAKPDRQPGKGQDKKNDGDD